MNLGTIPPVPPSLLARGVPEPSGAVAAGLLAWVGLRRRGRGGVAADGLRVGRCR